jgi:phosphohistidine phosphatase
MKHIIFIRHAKSEWEYDFLKDIDRPLNERGYRDAYQMSNWFLNNKKLPQLILTSTATRALSTALMFARTLNFNMTNFVLNETIYESSEQNIIFLLQQLNNNVNEVMLFGHNPFVSNICNSLTQQVSFNEIPTCGITHLSIDVKSWVDIETKKAKIEYQHYPKDLKNNL